MQSFGCSFQRGGVPKTLSRRDRQRRRKVYDVAKKINYHEMHRWHSKSGEKDSVSQEY